LSNFHIVDTCPFKMMMNIDKDPPVDHVYVTCQPLYNLCMNFILLYKFMCLLNVMLFSIFVLMFCIFFC